MSKLGVGHVLTEGHDPDLCPQCRRDRRNLVAHLQDERDRYKHALETIESQTNPTESWCARVARRALYGS